MNLNMTWDFWGTSTASAAGTAAGSAWGRLRKLLKFEVCVLDDAFISLPILKESVMLNHKHSSVYRACAYKLYIPIYEYTQLYICVYITYRL